MSNCSSILILSSDAVKSFLLQLIRYLEWKKSQKPSYSLCLYQGAFAGLVYLFKVFVADQWKPYSALRCIAWHHRLCLFHYLSFIISWPCRVDGLDWEDACRMTWAREFLDVWKNVVFEIWYACKHWVVIIMAKTDTWADHGLWHFFWKSRPYAACWSDYGRNKLCKVCYVRLESEITVQSHF